MSQESRVAVVTGAARGIGAATARRLAADGLAVAVVDLTEAAAGGTVEEIVAGEPARIRYRTTTGELADPRTLHGLPALIGVSRARTGHVELESRDLQVNHAVAKFHQVVHDLHSQPRRYLNPLRPCRRLMQVSKRRKRW